MLTLCRAHKIKLAISDTFKKSASNNASSQNCINIFYLFRRANLRRWLFKRQAVFEGVKHLRPEGTRWVKHPRDVRNLVVLIGFYNNQISSPYNDSIKKLFPS